MSKRVTLEDYEPFRDNLYRARMIVKLKNSKTFRNVFRNDLTLELIKDIRNIANPNFQFTQNTIITMSGLTGTGKSICMMSLGKLCFPGFGYKNMFFFDQQILDNAEKFPKDTLIVRDENPAKAIFGMGSTRTSGQFTVMAETCRKAGLSLGLIEPSFAQIPITKIYLETIDMDIGKRYTRLGLIDNHTLNYLGAILLPILPETHPDWVKYNQVKDRFIEAVKKGDFSGSKLDYRQMAQDIMASEDYSHCKTKKDVRALLVTTFTNLTNQEIETIQSIINIEERKGGE